MTPGATLNRPDLATMAERLRSFALRWRALARTAKADADKAPARYLIAEAYEDAAELLEARLFKLDLGGGSGPRKKQEKAPRVRRQDRVLELLDLGPMSVHDVSIALGCASRKAYESLIELHRAGVITRREIKSEGRHRGPYQHLYYKEGR